MLLRSIFHHFLFSSFSLCVCVNFRPSCEAIYSVIALPILSSPFLLTISPFPFAPYPSLFLCLLPDPFLPLPSPIAIPPSPLPVSPPLPLFSHRLLLLPSPFLPSSPSYFPGLLPNPNLSLPSPIALPPLPSSLIPSFAPHP